jgi:hypothetical protein
MPTLPRLALLLPVLAFAGTVLALDPKPTPNLGRVKKDLEFLAGDECQGRGLETKGILKAGEHVEAQFKAAGLKPAFPDGYFQPFEVLAPAKLGTPISLTLRGGDTVLEPKVTEEFVATLASGGGKSKAGVVFAGYGITSADPKYDDYAGLDVKGKVVVVLRRVPQAGDPKGPFGENSPHAPLASKLLNAQKHGAAGVLFVSDAGTAADTDPLLKPDQTDGVRLDGPVLHVKRAVADALLKGRKTTLAEVEAGIANGLKPNSFPLDGWEAEAVVTMVRRKLPARNVVGVLDGAGPLADETVVIGAHYDHLGYGEQGSFPGSEGKVHYGADDNASGTTGLLELARRYGAVKNRQGRRLVFAAFSGEEQGLFGSKHYCEHPPFPLDKTAFMLNMDMIGRVVPTDVPDANGGTTKKDRLVVYGTGTSTGLDKLTDDLNKPFDFKLMKVPGGSGPSDHASFYAKRVPVLFFFTGTHRDYHRPTDTPDKINAAGLLKVVDYVQALADHYAAVKQKPDYLAAKGGNEDPTDTTRRSFSGPRLGIMPGYGEDVQGAVVSGVSPGGAAEKGGLKTDDVIVELAGKPVTSVEGYTAVLRTLTPGAEVEVVVKRGGQTLKLKVTPQK